MNESIVQIAGRAEKRHRGIWIPFASNTLAHKITHVITRYMSLYAQTYQHGVKALKSMADQELQRLIGNFELTMQKIDADTQNAIMEEAARRHLHSLDMQLRDAQNSASYREVQGEIEQMDVRIAALEADWMALDTQKRELEVTRTELINQLSRIQQQIDEEELNRARAEQELTEGELQYLRSQLDLKRAELEAAEAQIEIDVYQARFKQKQAELQTREAEKLRTLAQEDEIDARVVQEETRQEQAKLDKEDVQLRIGDHELTLEQETLRRSEAALDMDRADGRIEDMELEKDRADHQILQSEHRMKESEYQKRQIDEVRRKELGLEEGQSILQRKETENQIDSTHLDKAGVEGDMADVDVDMERLSAQKISRESQIMEAEHREHRTLNYEIPMAELERKRIEFSALEEELREAEAKHEQKNIDTVQIPQAELDKVRADLSITEAKVRAIDIQARIVEAALEQASVDADVKQEEARTIQHELDQAEAGFIPIRAEGEKDIYEAEQSAIKNNKKSSITEHEKREQAAKDREESLEDLDPSDPEGYKAQIYGYREDAVKANGSLARERAKVQRDNAKLSASRAEARRKESEKVDKNIRDYAMDAKDEQVSYIQQGPTSQGDMTKAIESMMKDLENLEITNNLTHLIGQAGS